MSGQRRPGTGEPSAEQELRVLVVEDNLLDFRALCRELNNAAGTVFQIQHAQDFGSALELLAADPVDCVLLDLSLPDSEGLVSVDTLTRSFPSMAVVVLTGLEDPATAVAAVERGAQDYLMKDEITSELVQRSIQYAVARHGHESKLRSVNDLVDRLQERDRIARDLHDTVIQNLFATGMSLQSTAAGLADNGLRARLLGNVDDIDSAIRQLREAIFGLHSHETGGTFAEEIAKVVSNHNTALGFVPHVSLGEVGAITPDVEHEMLAVINEAVANIARHASATAAEITIEVTDHQVNLRVVDNGRGLARGPSVSPGPGSGRGVKNMESRAEALGGTLTIRPGLGGGVAVHWTVPLRESGPSTNQADQLPPSQGG